MVSKGKLSGVASTRVPGMSTLYQILGLPQGASEQELKAAFRELARRFHPDVNAGDTITEQRFKEINHAYQTLSDPGARWEYDRALVCQREEIRRRFRGLAATATAVFTLTTGVISLAALWGQEAAGVAQSVPAQVPGAGSSPEKSAQLKSQPRVDAEARPESGAPASASAQTRGRGSSWTTYRNDRFRFSLKYPADVFAFNTGPANDNGITLISAEGGATLRIFAARNVTGTTLARYRRTLIQNRYPDVNLDHTPQSTSWFVLSGTQGDKVLYEHVAFSCDGRSIRGWQMMYPSSERTLYDLVADEVHRSFTSSAQCKRAKKDRRRRTPREDRARRP